MPSIRKHKDWSYKIEAMRIPSEDLEDVLEVYQRPEDPNHPVVCVDEKSQQHIREIRTPLLAPGIAGAIISEMVSVTCS